jgi:hypothetical protein
MVWDKLFSGGTGSEDKCSYPKTARLTGVPASYFIDL